MQPSYIRNLSDKSCKSPREINPLPENQIFWDCCMPDEEEEEENITGASKELEMEIKDEEPSE